MRAQLNPLVGHDAAQPFMSASPTHAGPHPRAAYGPGLVPTPRAPGDGGPVLGTGAGAGAGVGATALPIPAPPTAQVQAQEEEEERGEELATALYDYKPSDDDELGFARGDVIVVSAHTTEDWWTGKVQGRFGPDKLFPANYVELRSVSTTAADEKSKGLAGPASQAQSYPPQGYGAGAPAYPPQGYGAQAYPPQGYGASAYPPAQAEQYNASGGDGAAKGKFNKFAKSNVGQAAATGAAFGTCYQSHF